MNARLVVIAKVNGEILVIAVLVVVVVVVLTACGGSRSNGVGACDGKVNKVREGRQRKLGNEELRREGKLRQGPGKQTTTKSY